MSYLYCIFTDENMFWLLQSALLVITVTLFILDRVGIYRSNGGFKKKDGGATFIINRGEKTVTFYRVAFGAVSGLMITICLFVDVINGYRIIWILIDIALPLYIIMFNHWARNKLSVLHGYLLVVEQR